MHRFQISEKRRSFHQYPSESFPESRLKQYVLPALPDRNSLMKRDSQNFDLGMTGNGNNRVVNDNKGEIQTRNVSSSNGINERKQSESRKTNPEDFSNKKSFNNVPTENLHRNRGDFDVKLTNGARPKEPEKSSNAKRIEEPTGVNFINIKRTNFFVRTSFF